jgi:hypothetical protein
VARVAAKAAYRNLAERFSSGVSSLKSLVSTLQIGDKSESLQKIANTLDSFDDFVERNHELRHIASHEVNVSDVTGGK